MTKAKSAAAVKEQASTGANQAPENQMKFLDLRSGNEDVVEITDDKTGRVVAQIRTTQIVKWDPETKGVLLGSWLKVVIEKPRGDAGAMIPVLSYIESKNKKGFMYKGIVPNDQPEVKGVSKV